MCTVRNMCARVCGCVCLHIRARCMCPHSLLRPCGGMLPLSCIPLLGDNPPPIPGLTWAAPCRPGGGGWVPLSRPVRARLRPSRLRPALRRIPGPEPGGLRLGSEGRRRGRGSGARGAERGYGRAAARGYRDPGDPFKYDYDTLRLVGLVLAIVMFFLGIFIALSKKFKCKQPEPSLSADPQRTATSVQVLDAAPAGP